MKCNMSVKITRGGCAGETGRIIRLVSASPVPVWSIALSDDGGQVLVNEENLAELTGREAGYHGLPPPIV